MAQPAITKKPLGISPFWQKASADPPVEWGKMESAIILGYNCQRPNRFIKTTPKPSGTWIRISHKGETNVQIRDRNLRNQEKKVTWKNQCAQLDRLGPTVDGVPWDEADIKCRSYIYLCLGAEGQRRISQYYSDLRIQETTTRDFWARLTRLFVKERNVTFDRYETFTRKQGKTETLEEFHCGLTELVVKGNFTCTACNDGGLESEIIRDLFTANMTNDEVQKDLLAETKTPDQALNYAIRRERGLENQVHIRKQGSSHSHTGVPNIKSEPMNFVQRRVGYKSQFRGWSQSWRNNAEKQFGKTGRKNKKLKTKSYKKLKQKKNSGRKNNKLPIYLG